MVIFVAVFAMTLLGTLEVFLRVLMEELVA